TLNRRSPGTSVCIMLRMVRAAGVAAVVVGPAACSAASEREAPPTGPGPLDGYFAHVNATDRDSTMARELEIQGLIAECMIEQGLEHAAWSACMSETGWPGLRTQRDALESVLAWGEGTVNPDQYHRDRAAVRD